MSKSRTKYGRRRDFDPTHKSAASKRFAKKSKELAAKKARNAAKKGKP